MEINDNEIVLTKENGEKEVAKILFYFHNDQRGKDYYFLYKEENPDDVIVMSSSDGTSLDEVDDEEFDEAEQVFEAFQEDPKIEEARK
ncbi:MAG: DUF1292 domain-containing protein [Candidatus Enteromonas sp.]|nr:DUF1292 domain-containing protein [bacterium]MDD6917214.1 DUF1292 domain-containing protein [bacterium]MDY6100256.1 DUF1292 domain-containing protein [Candidatus Enteromonas sp.]